jgi:hypothetical protein
MDDITKGILSVKLLEACGGDANSAVYSQITDIGEDIKLHTHTLYNLPQVIDSAIEIFTGNKSSVAKGSVYYTNLKREKENILKSFGDVLEIAGHKKQVKISQDKYGAALSAVSCLYIESFISPIQFFVPYSSVCSGRWDFWSSIDLFAYKERLQDKEFNFKFREKIMKSKIWEIKFDLKDFPLLVQRRLIKDKILNKKLSTEAMIKAMIIRLGETGRPFINYEVIDFSIREFFTYLGAKKYLRIDREMEFLRRLDKEIISILRENL